MGVRKHASALEMCANGYQDGEQWKASFCLRDGAREHTSGE